MKTDNATDYVLSTGFPLELLEKILKNSGLSVAEFAEALRKLLDDGFSVDEIIAEYRETYPGLLEPENNIRFAAKSATSFGDRRTVYLWYPYLVRSEVNICMASGGSGKTFFTCKLAADVTQQRALPGDFKPKQAENVLMISAEETGELLKERLTACDADLSKVFLLDISDSCGLDFQANPDALQALIAEYHPALVCIDPLQAFIGAETDLNRTNAVRPIMQRLSRIAKAESTTILLVMHVNKRPQTDNLNHAASGSSDFVNASRSALYIARDEENEKSKLVIHSKSNYAPEGRTIRFTFDDNGGIYWNGFSEIDRYTVEEANRKRKTPGEIVQNTACQEETADMLIRALLDAASPSEIRRYSYDSFKERYGGSIFGTQQPKRILDSVTGKMRTRGFLLETGRKVKDGSGGIPKNGFVIAPENVDETQLEMDG